LLDLINPVNHSRTPAQMRVYAAEPYVLAGDVYAVAPHTGRGGWSWYTGSAGWMYRLIVESLLGIRRDEHRLHLAPRLRSQWPGYKLSYRYGNTRYQIEVQRGDFAQPELTLSLDGEALPHAVIELVDDGVEHFVQVLVAMR